MSVIENIDVNEIKDNVTILMTRDEDGYNARNYLIDVFSGTVFLDEFGDDIDRFIEQKKYSFMIDYNRLSEYLSDKQIELPNISLQLDLVLRIKPEYIIREIEFFLKRIVNDRGYYPPIGPHVRLTGAMPDTTMTDLIQKSHLMYGELYRFEGLIIAVSQPTSIAIERVYRCSKCYAEQRLYQPEGIVLPPESCTNSQCNSTKFKHLPSYDKQRLIQYMIIQQTPDEVRGSTEAYKLNIELFDDLINDVSVRPGDPVIVCGYLRRSHVQIRTGQRPKYRYYFKCLYIEKKRRDTVETKISDDRKHELLDEIFINSLKKHNDEYVKLKDMINTDESLSEDEKYEKNLQLSTEFLCNLLSGNYKFDLINAIRDSFAPNILGKQYEPVKLGLAVSLFTKRISSAISLSSSNEKKYKIRDVSHVLVIGDASTGKLEMIKFLELVSPHLLTSNGPSLTGKGITVGLSNKKDADTGERMMHIGAYIIADGGTLVIDEFDKMDKTYFADILQPMESLVVEKDVTGFGFQKFNARTGLIGFGNPKKGRWNPSLDLTENFYIPNYLWSRFDLIFAIVDKYSSETDSLIAKFRGQLRSKRKLPSSHTPPFGFEWIRDYIIYTQQFFDPILSDDAIKYISKEYTKIRKEYNPTKLAEHQFATTGRASEVSGPSITPRNLEGFYRLAIALARMEMSDVVTVMHAKRAISLFLDAVRSINNAIGNNGVVDPGYLTTGKSSIREKNPWRNNDYKVSNRVKMFLSYIFKEQRSEPIKESVLKQMLVDEVLSWSVGATKLNSESQAEKIITILRKKGKLIDERGNGNLRYV